MLNIDARAIKKAPDLTLPEFLLLATIKDDIELLFIDDDFRDNETKLLIDKLDEKGYIRVIDNTIVLDSKAIQVFRNNLTIKAQEVLDYMNELKSDLGISNKPFTLHAHARDLVARLGEGNEVEDIKEMVKFKYQSWLGTEWQKYLRPSTLFNKTKFYNYIEEMEMNNSRNMSSIHQMV